MSRLLWALGVLSIQQINFASQIGNHDNKRVGTRYPDMQDAMNMISLSLPGTAMTYYGEELGMTDAFISWEQTKDPSAINMGPEKYLRVSRDPCRTPMQWDDSTSAGEYEHCLSQRLRYIKHHLSNSNLFDVYRFDDC